MADTDDFEAAQLAEYGSYVATEPINIGGVRAFNAGDPVPKGHVTAGLVPAASVAKTNTKAATAATADPTPAPPAPVKE